MIEVKKVNPANADYCLSCNKDKGIYHVRIDKQDKKTKTIIDGIGFSVCKTCCVKAYFSHNPCSRVTLPKREKKEKPIYTREQTEKLLNLLQYEPLEYQVFFTIATYSGLRRGEMLGMEWKDISWQTGVIKISRTSNYTKHRGIFTDKTKTERSKRLIKAAFVLRIGVAFYYFIT
jgi:integrase